MGLGGGRLKEQRPQELISEEAEGGVARGVSLEMDHS